MRVVAIVTKYHYMMNNNTNIGNLQSIERPRGIF